MIKYNPYLLLIIDDWIWLKLFIESYRKVIKDFQWVGSSIYDVSVQQLVASSRLFCGIFSHESRSGLGREQLSSMHRMWSTHEARVCIAWSRRVINFMVSMAARTWLQRSLPLRPRRPAARHPYPHTQGSITYLLVTPVFTFRHCA